ncbi:MAG: AbrB/MazE/SpoVT family DNA-binding domain-containing protein [Planctomycetaceae bacterium]|jgi:antitoxin MazE|nr:AbrB/MazE/SpoVT family DNA-binding domain-containing protein [Planctomycetaceae bacterium]
MAFISTWGNNQGLQIPAEIIQRLGLNTNDKVFLEVENDKLLISKVPTTAPRGTLEELFRDYSGESFRTELTNPNESVGKEQW